MQEDLGFGNQKSGKIGEAIAVAFLKKSGYRIIEMNYRCSLGEIDIIAIEKKVLVFIEVKSRNTDRFGLPQAAVGIKKQRKLSMLAQFYLQEKKLQQCRARFDVIAVKLNRERPRVELIRNAFELSYGF